MPIWQGTSVTRCLAATVGARLAVLAWRLPLPSGRALSPWLAPWPHPWLCRPAGLSRDRSPRQSPRPAIRQERHQPEGRRCPPQPHAPVGFPVRSDRPLPYLPAVLYVPLRSPRATRSGQESSNNCLSQKRPSVLKKAPGRASGSSGACPSTAVKLAADGLTPGDCAHARRQHPPSPVYTGLVGIGDGRLDCQPPVTARPTGRASTESQPPRPRCVRTLLRAYRGALPTDSHSLAPAAIRGVLATNWIAWTLGARATVDILSQIPATQIDETRLL